MSPTPSRPAAAVPGGASAGQVADLPGGVRICYQPFGDPSADPLLLVMGLGGPMTWWDPVLCAKLADAGFFVIRYDNRDTGRSGRARGRVTQRMLVQHFLGRGRRTPYTLDDMAGARFGLPDRLRPASAAAACISMGGTVPQTVGSPRPGRARSQTSVLSTTREP